MHVHIYSWLRGMSEANDQFLPHPCGGQLLPKCFLKWKIFSRTPEGTNSLSKYWYNRNKSNCVRDESKGGSGWLSTIPELSRKTRTETDKMGEIFQQYRGPLGPDSLFRVFYMVFCQGGRQGLKSQQGMDYIIEITVNNCPDGDGWELQISCIAKWIRRK